MTLARLAPCRLRSRELGTGERSPGAGTEQKGEPRVTCVAWRSGGWDVFGSSGIGLLGKLRHLLPALYLQSKALWVLTLTLTLIPQN